MREYETLWKIENIKISILCIGAPRTRHRRHVCVAGGNSLRAALRRREKYREGGRENYEVRMPDAGQLVLYPVRKAVCAEKWFFMLDSAAAIEVLARARTDSGSGWDVPHVSTRPPVTGVLEQIKRQDIEATYGSPSHNVTYHPTIASEGYYVLLLLYRLRVLAISECMFFPPKIYLFYEVLLHFAQRVRVLVRVPQQQFGLPTRPAKTRKKHDQ